MEKPCSKIDTTIDMVLKEIAEHVNAWLKKSDNVLRDTLH